MLKHKSEITLNGQWQFRLDPDQIGEHYPEQLDTLWKHDARWMLRSHPETNWDKIRVPSCWQVEGYDYNGAAWYRKSFSESFLQEGELRAWLVFDGVDYYADTWFNERYLGSHEGYFAQFQYEITPYLEKDNVVVVKVDSPRDVCAKERQKGQLKSTLKGALERWDVNNPEVNPGGIWNKVKIVTTGPAAITDLNIHTHIPDVPETPVIDHGVPAVVAAEIELAPFPSPEKNKDINLHVQLSPMGFRSPEVQRSLSIRALPCKTKWQLVIDLEEAHLWYTWDIGRPHLYEMTVVVEVDGTQSDSVQQTFGFRKIERKAGWATYINGIRFFQRGANYLSDQLLSNMSYADYEEDIKMIKVANLNTVHPFCVVEKQEFYDLCDRYGLLVYQDIPLWLVAENRSDLVRRAEGQLRELIGQYGHHPSIGVWNFGSQPSVANFEKLGSALAHTARELDPSRVIQQGNALIDIPSDTERDPVDDFHWTEDTAERFRTQYDWRIDAHHYYGWYGSRGLSELNSIPEKYLELITEYGAQALPDRGVLETFIPEESLSPPDFRKFQQHCFQPEYQFKYIDEQLDLDEMIERSQAYQARFIQHHTEFYRRHKFAPCNGAHLFCFNDCWPAITWSVIDYYRNPKQGYYALQKAMEPIQASAEFESPMKAGIETTTTLWIINDRIEYFKDLSLRWIIKSHPTGDILAQGELECEIPENSCKKIDHIQWIPKPGAIEVELEVVSEDRTIVNNHYDLVIED